MKKSTFSVSLFLICGLILGAQGNAAEQQSVDSVLVLDSSGSMKKTDPQGLRIPAAKMFVSLLNKGDRSSIVSFSDAGYPVVYLSEVSKHEERLHKGADRISTKGIHTNLAGALEAAVRVLDREKQQNPRRFIVLMSDGKMDLGDAKREQQLTKDIHEKILPGLVEQKVKVYTIAFTSESDVELLKTIAKATGGLFHLAKTDKELHEIYTKIFEDGKQPNMLPIDNGDFMVDASIQEITIVASKLDTGVRIALETPDGVRYTAKKHAKGVKWFNSNYFEMITIQNPVQGKWRLFSSGKADKAYVVTDLGLATNLGDGALASGSEATIAAWLEMKGHIVKSPEMLATTKFKMEMLLPNVGSSEYELFDKGVDGKNVELDGIVSNTIAFEKEGRYEVTIRSTGATFQRERTFHLDVEAPALLPVPVGVVANQEPVVNDDVAIEAVEESQAEEIEALEPKLEPVEPKVEIAEEQELSEESPVEDEGFSTAEILTGFVLINVVILLLVVAGVMLKKRKEKSSLQGDDKRGSSDTSPKVIEDDALDSLDDVALDKDQSLDSLDEISPDKDLSELDDDLNLDSLDDLKEDESLDDLLPDQDRLDGDRENPLEGLGDELDDLDELKADMDDLDNDLDSLDGKAADDLTDLDDLIGDESLDDLLADDDNKKEKKEVDPLDELGEDLDDLLKDDSDNPKQK